MGQLANWPRRNAALWNKFPPKSDRLGIILQNPILIS